jgi:hypothetical protein
VITSVVNPALSQMVCASIILSPTKSGTIARQGAGVAVAEGVAVGVAVGVDVGNGVGVAVGVAVGVGLGPSVVALATFE